jgi:hypothetical protein
MVESSSDDDEEENEDEEDEVPRPPAPAPAPEGAPPLSGMIIQERSIQDPLFPGMTMTAQGVFTTDFSADVAQLPPLRPEELMPPPAQAAAQGGGKKKRKRDQPVGPKKKGGRGAQYTEEETDLLLDILDEILPVGALDWIQVRNKFNDHVTEKRKRTKEALQRKFNGMHQTKVPTGDPNMPHEIWRAKSIADKVLEKSNAQVLVDGDGELQFRLNSAPPGDDDSNSDGVPNTPAVNRREVPTSDSTRGGASIAARRRQRSDTEDPFLKAFLLQAKMDSERWEQQRQRDEQRERKERIERETLYRKEREREKRDAKREDERRRDQNMMLAAILSAFNNNNQGRGLATMPRPTASNQSPSQGHRRQYSSSETEYDLSSIHTDDSSPTIQAKLRAGKRFKNSKPIAKSPVESPVKSPAKATIKSPSKATVTAKPKAKEIPRPVIRQSPRTLPTAQSKVTRSNNNEKGNKKADKKKDDDKKKKKK